MRRNFDRQKPAPRLDKSNHQWPPVASSSPATQNGSPVAEVFARGELPPLQIAGRGRRAVRGMISNPFKRRRRKPDLDLAGWQDEYAHGQHRVLSRRGKEGDPADCCLPPALGGWRNSGIPFEPQLPGAVARGRPRPRDLRRGSTTEFHPRFAPGRSAQNQTMVAGLPSGDSAVSAVFGWAPRTSRAPERGFVRAEQERPRLMQSLTS